MKFQAILGVLVVLICMSCAKDEVQPAVSDPSTTTPVNTDTSVKGVTDADKLMLRQFKQLADIYDKDEIWKGYRFSERAIYMVFKDENGNGIRGYLINPHKEISGANKLGDDVVSGLNVYRFDDQAEAGIKELETGNGLYTFDYNIEGKEYYLQSYTASEITDLLNPSMLVAAHEVFHEFQFSAWVEFGIQDEENYPITKDLVALQILTLKIAEKLPAIKDKNQLRKYMEMFVAIRSKEMAIDPSNDKLVKNMANAQETGEGTARYIEHLAGAQIFEEFDPVFSQGGTSSIASQKEVREFFAFSIWYGTGAALSYMIDELTDTIEDKTAMGISLFDQADQFLNMTAMDKESRLADAKAEFNWNQVEQESNRLLALQ